MSGRADQPRTRLAGGELDEQEENPTLAVKLRLMRMGKKKQPTYRIVAADSRSPRNGRFIEIVGTYQPRLEPSGILVDNEKAVKWLRNGAKPTETVEKLLRISGAWDEFTGTTSAPAAPALPQAAGTSASGGES
jgi:small subunit ribosomal protein S16